MDQCTPSRSHSPHIQLLGPDTTVEHHVVGQVVQVSLMTSIRSDCIGFNSMPTVLLQLHRVDRVQLSSI